MSAAAVASGLLAGDPLACVLASVSGFFALLDPWRMRPAAGVARCPRAFPLAKPDVRFTALFRSFRGDETPSAGVNGTEARANASAANSSPPGPDRDDESDDSDGTDSAYEEFAAGLEAGDAEEISFLPPYVTGGETVEAEDQTDGTWEPPTVDSPLLQELNDVLDLRSRMPMPRRFALGTVAILRNLLDPDEVSRILEEQRRYPRLRFGDIALELGLLTREQRDEMVRAQQEGVFTDQEIRDAKRRLESHYARGGRHG